MKTVIFIIVCLCLASCDGQFNSFLKPGDTTAISVLRDDTDSNLTRPNSEIINLYGISNARLRDGYVYRDRAISDVSLQHVKQEYIKPATYLNSDDNSRVAELKAFKAHVIHYIDSLVGVPYKPKGNSLVYQAIISELTNLQQTGAANKYMIIYSDMLQNSDEFSFYKSKDFEEAKLHPEKVVTRFEKMGAMPNLTGIKIYIINNPHSYADEKKFDVAISVFKLLVEQKHGELIVASNINPEIHAK
jgi:hypothetical protein